MRAVRQSSESSRARAESRQSGVTAARVVSTDRVGSKAE